jgi:hypothetical protein
MAFDIVSVLETASRTSEDECKWYWHQMIYFLKQEYNKARLLMGYNTYTMLTRLYNAQQHSLCA